MDLWLPESCEACRWSWNEGSGNAVKNGPENGDIKGRVTSGSMVAREL